MKITIPASSILMNGIRTVLNVVPPKATLPILSNMLLETEDDHLTIGATDLDLSIVTKIPSQVTEAGSITVPGRKFAEMVRELPDAPVEIEVDGVKVVIRCDRGVFRLVGIDKEEYPALPDVPTEQTVTIPASSLQRLIRKTVYAVSKDETHPSLWGAYLSIVKGAVRMVATDAHRLAKTTLPCEVDDTVTEGIIVPPKALNNLSRLIGESDAPSRITIGDSHVLFDLENARLYARLIEATYPDYERYIPTDNDKIVKVNRDVFEGAVRRVSVLSNSVTRQIQYSARPGFIELSSSSHDIGGEAKEEMPAEYEGEAIDTTYDFRYLLDVVERIESDDLVFKLDSPVSAGIVTPSEEEVEGEDHQCLIMPLRVTG
ncbi:MAG: DNA polymerase III subunit beta [Gemmatimonadetes bacterium]|nr:DNA polymerase III subunit beta [Gemmatimonadota bacterium]